MVRRASLRRAYFVTAVLVLILWDTVIRDVTVIPGITLPRSFYQRIRDRIRMNDHLETELGILAIQNHGGGLGSSY